MDEDKKKRLNSLVKTINKKFGENTLDTAANLKKIGRLSKKVIPTPSLELNEALWCGGLSGIVEVYGQNSSGKTSLMIETISLNQNNNPNFCAAWLETEGSVTEEILEQHNVDLDRLLFLKQEDVLNAENALDVARGIISSGEVDMLVVNSVAGLSPSVEIESDLIKQNISLTARIMSKFFRVSIGLISKNDMVVCFINQMRDNVGQMFGDPSTTTGGKALSYYASQRIRMSQVKVESSDPITAEEGVKISCLIKKNRFAGRHNALTKCKYFATYANGIDPIAPLPLLLQEKGIMEVSGRWWYYKDKQGNFITIDGIEGKFGSKAEFVNVLRNNTSWQNTMLNLVKTGPIEQTVEEQEAAKYEQAQIESFMSKQDEDNNDESPIENLDLNIDSILNDNSSAI